MNYLPGDVLLKRDNRAWYTPSDTRHHMMLVVGEESQCPIVAHITFNGKKTGRLMIERLKHTKELMLIRAPFTERLREKIQNNAYYYFKNYRCILTQELLNQQASEAQTFRPNCELQAAQSNTRLHEEYRLKRSDMTAASSAQFFKPKPIIHMSCHQFVLTMIQMACAILSDEDLPEGFQIPAELAWADLTLNSARFDTALSVHDLNQTDVSRPKSSDHPPKVNVFKRCFG